MLSVQLGIGADTTPMDMKKVGRRILIGSRMSKLKQADSSLSQRSGGSGSGKQLNMGMTSFTGAQDKVGTMDRNQVVKFAD